MEQRLFSGGSSLPANKEIARPYGIWVLILNPNNPVPTFPSYFYTIHFTSWLLKWPLPFGFSNQNLETDILLLSSHAGFTPILLVLLDLITRMIADERDILWSYSLDLCLFFININLYNCSCNCICIVFIVCSVSFIVCVVSYTVFCLSVKCVICLLCVTVVPLSPS
jgi:hypothetical protein